MARIVGSARFWVIVVLLAAISISHYSEHLGIPYTVPRSIQFAVTRHAQDRVLFLFPMIYAGFVFGLRAGLATALVSLLVMLPHALFLSPLAMDALLETGFTVVIGILASLWLSTRVKERDQYSQALKELEVAHRQLQHYVRLARSNEKRLTILNAISTMLSQSLEPKEVVREAVNMVSEMLEVEIAMIFLLDEESQALILAAHQGVSEEFAREVWVTRLGEGFIGRVAQIGEPLVVRDASQDPSMNTAEARRMRIRRQLIVPVRCKGKIVGVLCVAMRHPREFLNEEVELLTAIANQIGISIENARLYEKEREIAEELRLSERRYRALFEDASDAIWVHDLEGNILTANPAAARLTGYSIAQLTQMNVNHFLSEAGLSLAREIRTKLFQNETLDEPYEQRLIRKDGTEATVKLTSSLIRENGRPVGFQNIARDVTEEKRMQENLRFYLEHFARAQEEERRRVARELHDDTMQVLFALSRQVDSFIRDNPHLHGLDVGFLQRVHREVQGALEGLRRFSQDLRPPMLDELGLLPALRWLAGEMERRCGLRADFRVLGEERRFSPEVELTLFRIVQEGLRNVERHAQASRVEVTVEFCAGNAKIIVGDDGVGFQPPQKVEDLPRNGKLGLAGMHERVRLLGGTLTLQSEPGKGATIAIEVPI